MKNSGELVELNDSNLDFAKIQAIFNIDREKVVGAIIHLKWYFPLAEITEVHVISFLLAKYPLAEDEKLKNSLSGRTYNALKRRGYKTYAQVSTMTDGELLDIPNFGLKMLNEVKGMVEKEGK